MARLRGRVPCWPPMEISKKQRTSVAMIESRLVWSVPCVVFLSWRTLSAQKQKHYRKLTIRATFLCGAPNLSFVLVCRFYLFDDQKMEGLPAEIWVKIFGLLTPSQLARLCLVCTSWNQFINDPFLVCSPSN